MVQASIGEDGKGTNKAGDVGPVNPSFSSFLNAIYIYFSCADERGHYPSKCVVEQIFILGLKKQPSSVTTHSSGKETSHLFL